MRRDHPSQSRAAALAFVVRVALPLLLTFASGCAAHSKQASSAALSRYPHSPALDQVAQAHQDAANDREGLLMLSTWFLDGDPRVAMMCRVRTDGHVTTFRYMSNFSEGTGAIQSSQSMDLVPDQFAAVRETIRSLPESQKPALENLLVISFPRGEQWLTRTYDRTNLPTMVAQLFATTGAPIEPALR